MAEIREVIDQAGNPLRVSGGGLAFAVGTDGSPASAEITLDTSISRVQEGGDSSLTVEQIHEKMAAAEARRQAALDEIRQRGAEETNKLEKASEQRQQAVEGIAQALDAKMDNAQANQEAQREALLERLRKEEAHHELVLSRRADDFHHKVLELDERYAKQDGKRHEILGEIVEKVKEHNERVQMIHDEYRAHQQNDQMDGNSQFEGKRSLLKKRWLDASQQREAFFTSSEARLRTANLY